MEELTIEQKAKLYDKALEKARQLCAYPTSKPFISDLQDLFPELKQDGDERIRKELLNHCKDKAEKYSNDPKYKNISEWISWIEKQGKKDVRQKFLEDLLVADDIYQMAMNDTMVEEARTKAIEAISKIEISQLLGIEKQGEQKPQGKSALEAIKEEKIDNQNCIKPADKVESKVKIEKGKWYVCTQTFVLRGKEVIIKGQAYQADKDNVIKGEDGCLFIDRHDGKASDYLRSWNIQDARDGDVLTCESGWTCIFKTLVNEETFSSYCFMDNTKWFCETGSEAHTLKEEFVKAYNGKIYPATKEQRNLLFTKMKEAGYEWDAEKKEPKKIEQPKLTKFEDAIKDMMDDYRDAIGENDATVEEVKEHAAYLLSLVPCKPAEWSEEDEQYLLVCKNALAKYQITDKWDAHIIFHWLKNKLKLLRPQLQWKPSNEQIEVLQKSIKAYNEVSFPTEVRVLSSLCNELKKL